MDGEQNPTKHKYTHHAQHAVYASSQIYKQPLFLYVSLVRQGGWGVKESATPTFRSHVGQNTLTERPTQPAGRCQTVPKRTTREQDTHGAQHRVLAGMGGGLHAGGEGGPWFKVVAKGAKGYGVWEKRSLVTRDYLLIYRDMFYLEYLCKKSPYIQGQSVASHFLVSLHSMHKIKHLD